MNSDSKDELLCSPPELKQEGYEEVESLFHIVQIEMSRIKIGLQNCYHKIEDLIIAEDHDCPFLVHLFQLQQHMLELLKFMETENKKKYIKPSEIKPNETKSKEQQDLLNMVENTIETPRIQGFEEIAGLWEVKKMLTGLVILPKTQPQLFENRKIFNSLLLFGPPGTGKTRLVHALAYAAEANLFCVTAGHIMGPYIGQTEKNIRFLFEYIKNRQTFSLLFIDEVDGFCRKRSQSEQDHSRRIKTELLCQISQMADHSNFFLICATNCPWDLDSAFLRRFQKRVYVPLPDYAERRELFEMFTKNSTLDPTATIWENIIARTEGWSGSDISDLVQQAMNIPILELQDTKIWKVCSDGIYQPITDAEDYISLGDFVCTNLNDLPKRSVKARNFEFKDIIIAFETVNATVPSSEIQKYEEFCKQ